MSEADGEIERTRRWRVLVVVGAALMLNSSYGYGKSPRSLQISRGA